MSVEPRSRAARITALDYDYGAQPKRERRDCNLCGHDRFVTLSHRDRYGFDARAQGCLRCGFVFLNPVMTPEAYANFYREIYRPLVSAYHGRLIDAETIQDEQRTYARACAALLSPSLAGREVKTLLDIGGSTGIVAHHLKERFDLRATVIDPAPLELERARQLGLRTMTGFIEDYEFGEERFDLIVLCQTVDHLLDVAATLRKVRSLLREGGLFFLDIVDFRAAYRRNGSVEGAIKIDHPFYLTQETLEAFLRRTGFDTLHVDFAADHLHVGFVCMPGSSDPGFLVDPRSVSQQWHEIRSIQNPLPRATRENGP